MGGAHQPRNPRCPQQEVLSSGPDAAQTFRKMGVGWGLWGALRMGEGGGHSQQEHILSDGGFEAGARSGGLPPCLVRAPLDRHRPPHSPADSSGVAGPQKVVPGSAGLGTGETTADPV